MPKPIASAPIKPNLGAHLVPLGRCVPSGDNPRKYFDPEKLKELASNIRYLRTRKKPRGIQGTGILQALEGTVDTGAILADGSIKDGAVVTIRKGERRWRAAALAGFLPSDPLPVNLTEVGDPQDEMDEAFFENEHRDGMKPLEIADYIYAKQHSYAKPRSVRELAADLNKGKDYIQLHLDLKALPDEMKEVLRARPDAADTLQRINRLTDPKFQSELVEQVRNGATQKEIRQKIELRAQTDRAHTSSSSAVPADLKPDPNAGKYMVPRFDTAAEMEAMVRRFGEVEDALKPVIHALAPASKRKMRKLYAQLVEKMESLDSVLAVGKQ